MQFKMRPSTSGREPFLFLSLFLSKTVADCLKLSRSSKIVAMCLNLSLILSHVPAPKAQTSQGTIHGYVHGTTRPSPILTHPARSSRSTQPAPACPPSSTRTAKPADPARQARRPSPRCPPNPARRAPRPCQCPPFSCFEINELEQVVGEITLAQAAVYILLRVCKKL